MSYPTWSLESWPTCIICNSPKNETRPYGVDGSPVCFPCMQASPEREAEARKQLDKVFDLAGPGPFLLTSAGTMSLRKPPRGKKKGVRLS